MKFSADIHLQGLKEFQRATVEHVVRRFYVDDPPAKRFLVADETGLGKSMVARGVIARAIERLQHDDSVDRIDIVYVCSNADIAAQNLANLDVLNRGTKHHSTRLTLLARDSGDLEKGAIDPTVGKRVNLISFTPGTSFDMGGTTGRSDERVLLHSMLTSAFDLRSTSQRKAAAVVLRGSSGFDGFLRQTEAPMSALDSSIVQQFVTHVRSAPIGTRFMEEVSALGGRTRRVSRDEERVHADVVGQLRAALASVSVAALEPDLVILDEFQRFRHLLAADDPRYTEAAELADKLFSFGEARVLLLSATPYKPFTYAEEAAQGDAHEVDLRRTLGFLAGDQESDAVAAIVDKLGTFRTAVITGGSIAAVREELEDGLLGFMCRTERPRLGDDGMLAELISDAAQVSSDDVQGYVALRRLATGLDATAADNGSPLRTPTAVTVDYWKSSPYFVNFSDGYQLGQRLRESLKDPVARAALRPLLGATQHLDRDSIDELSPIDPGNARLRLLMEETIEQGWWKLLWVPPSLPYVPPAGPFAEPGASSMTKRLIFSSWMAAPSAIAALLSYEARRRSGASSTDASGRLTFKNDGGRPASMNALAVFWPSPGPAMAVDPRSEPSELPLARSGVRDGTYWAHWFEQPSVVPPELDIAEFTRPFSKSDLDDEAVEALPLAAHIDLAYRTNRSALDKEQDGVDQPDDADLVRTAIAQFGPGNIAYRCVHRISSSPADSVTTAERWVAAATLANGVRLLFNRSDTAQLLDQLLPDSVYWRAVLQYSAWGNLEAVLDEYLHHLASRSRADGMTGEELIAVVTKVVDAITLAPANYQAFDPLSDTPISFSGSRFALRYGSKQADKDESGRRPALQHAFNSPFWPFVLATTSVGQEGIDFHWWCHATIHWNTPASPIDFEQREGRVHRFGGHAVRRNLAERYRETLVERLSGTSNIWDLAYELGSDAAEQFGELTPHWIFEGRHKIQRHLFIYPLSHDAGRYQRLKEDLALYRLSFGQPRQEDLLDVLRKAGVATDQALIDSIRIDLRPRR